MSANFLNRLAKTINGWKWLHSGVAFAVLLPLWMLLGLAVSVIIADGVFYVLGYMGVSFVGIDSSIVESLYAAVIYFFTLAFVIGLPWLFRKYTTWQDMGLSRLLSWGDIGLAPVGFLVYFIASGILVYIASQVIPGFDASQTQATGFTRMSQYYEYLLAFITLIIVAPVAEELLFRGFLYGKLRSHMPVWLAMIITSALFGLIHFQWNVGVDVFALSLVLCSLREVTGNIWAGMLLHMLKNGVAFFIIFISPML